MTTIDTDQITDEATFTAALNALLHAGYDNDIDLAQPFECRNGPAYPDWEITIVEATKPFETASKE